METLPIHPASDLKQYIIEESSERIIFLIPFGIGIDVDMDQIRTFEDVRSCIDEMLPNGQQQITIILKQKSLSYDKRVIYYE